MKPMHRRIPDDRVNKKIPGVYAGDLDELS